MSANEHIYLIAVARSKTRANCSLDRSNPDDEDVQGRRVPGNVLGHPGRGMPFDEVANELRSLLYCSATNKQGHKIQTV